MKLWKRFIYVLLAAAIFLTPVTTMAQWPYICGNSFCEGTQTYEVGGTSFCQCRPVFENGVCLCTSGSATGGPCGTFGICIYNGV